MLLTEEEMKAKRCCGAPAIVSAVTASSYAAAYGPAQQIQANCVGSSCVAWRAQVERMSEQKEDGSWRDFDEVKGFYCGLAGKP